MVSQPLSKLLSQGRQCFHFQPVTSAPRFKCLSGRALKILDQLHLSSVREGIKSVLFVTGLKKQQYLLNTHWMNT